MPNRLYTNEILEGIMSLLETNLKDTLDLKGIYRGNIAWLPPSDLANMVNGIWLNLDRPVQLEMVTMPKGLLDTYKIRIIYIRRIDTTSNPLDQKIDDADTIANFVWDRLQLNNFISLSGGGKILWWAIEQVAYEPVEDNYVASLSADFMAVALDTEVQVRTSAR